MIAAQLVSDSVPPLRLTDSGQRALDWLREFDVDSLAVVEEGKLVGLISEDDIYDGNDAEQPISSYRLSPTPGYVDQYAHILEVIKLMVELHLTMIPVVNKDMEFLGTITMNSLVRFFSEIGSLNSPGAIIVLETKDRDYSMAEIARLVESNDCKILFSYTQQEPTTGTLTITLKLNASDISAVVATFSRHGYDLKASFQERDYTNELKDRYDEFMKYLNI